MLRVLIKVKEETREYNIPNVANVDLIALPGFVLLTDEKGMLLGMFALPALVSVFHL
jgi:hypothetical protein